jgi:DNA-binding HxlR family transcriptional regulator
MGINRSWVNIILSRLQQGPARPSEILKLMELDDDSYPYVVRAMTTLANRGKIHRTRIVLTGRHGGNVAVIYQLVR